MWTREKVLVEKIYMDKREKKGDDFLVRHMEKQGQKLLCEATVFNCFLMAGYSASLIHAKARWRIKSASINSITFFNHFCHLTLGSHKYQQIREQKKWKIYGFIVLHFI